MTPNGDIKGEWVHNGGAHDTHITVFLKWSRALIVFCWLNCFETKYVTCGKTCVSGKTVIIIYVWAGNFGQSKRSCQCISLLAGPGWSKISIYKPNSSFKLPMHNEKLHYTTGIRFSYSKYNQTCIPAPLELNAQHFHLHAAVWYEGWFIFALNINEWFRMALGLLSQPTNWSFNPDAHSHWFIYIVSLT